MRRQWIGLALAAGALAGTLVVASPAQAATGLTFSLRNAPSAGGVSVQMSYGPAESLQPVAGDWNGDGRTEIGITWAGTGGQVWSLASGLASGGASERYRMHWGASNDACVPVAGDHDGVGADSIGLACPDGVRRKWRWTFSTGLSNAGAGAVSYWFGPTHCKPFTGDWDGDGRHGVGVSCVTADGSLYALANNPNLVAEPAPSAQFYWGPPNANCRPVAGDWDGPDGGRSEKVGLACPTGTGNTWNWKLNNWNTSGGVWREFNYGNRANQPITGDWDGDGTTGIGVVAGVEVGGHDPLRREIADIARGQVGTRESGNNCNPYGPCDEWCAMFATWVWEQAGVPGVPRTEYAARGLGYWGVQRGLFRYRSQGAEPRVGDWLIYGTPVDTIPGHVDIVVAVGSPTSVTVVGGNVGNAVTLRVINPATATANGQAVSGYVSPPGADD